MATLFTLVWAKPDKLCSKGPLMCTLHKDSFEYIKPGSLQVMQVWYCGPLFLVCSSSQGNTPLAVKARKGK